MSNKLPKYLYAVVGKTTGDTYEIGISRKEARASRQYLIEYADLDENLGILQVPTEYGNYVR